MKSILIAAGLMLFSATAHAQHCNLVYRRHAVQAVAVVPAPIVLYQSASYARFDAELKEAARLGAQEALAQFYADAQAEADAAVGQLNAEDAAGVLDTKTGQFNPGPGWQGPVPIAPPTSQPEVVPANVLSGYIAANCLRCHNGPGGKGGVDLARLDAITLWRSADAVRHGRMPKGTGKPSENIAEIFSEAARKAP